MVKINAYMAIIGIYTTVLAIIEGRLYSFVKLPV